MLKHFPIFFPIKRTIIPLNAVTSTAQMLSFHSVWLEKPLNQIKMDFHWVHCLPKGISVRHWSAQLKTIWHALNLVRITWREAANTCLFRDTSQPQRGRSPSEQRLHTLTHWCYITTKPMPLHVRCMSTWCVCLILHPTAFLCFGRRLFHVTLHLSVCLHITSNSTVAADAPLMKTCVKKSTKQFLALQKEALQRKGLKS